MDGLALRHQNAGLSVVLLVMLLVCVAGCTPGIDLLNAKCSRLEKNGRLEGIRFHCDLETQHLKNTQIVYQVTLFNKEGDAVRSSDGKYDVKGQVGATRTLMILSNRQTFDSISVTIPKDQLEFGAKNIPVIAKFAVFLPDGKCLVDGFCALPAIRASEVMPPLVLPKTVYWFAKRPTRSSLPLLIGPYASIEKACKALRVKPDRLVKFETKQRLWYVPLRDSEGKKEVLIGGCISKKAALKVAGTLRNAAGARRALIVTGAPVELTLEAWLLKQKKKVPTGPDQDMVDALNRLGFKIAVPPNLPRKKNASL